MARKKKQARKTSTKDSSKFIRFIKKPVIKFLGVFVSLILTALITRFYEDIKHIFTAEPYVAIVMSETYPDFPIPKDFLKGFKNTAYANGGSENFIVNIDNHKVILDYKDDLGSIEEASRWANILASDENCILVIGNSNSTLSNTTLDIFLKAKNPPAYILPIATANEIITKSDTAKYNSILRMPPDNDKQAKKIAKLVRTLTKDNRVAIYADLENRFYSENLCRDTAFQIRENRGKVLIEEIIGGNHSFITSKEMWSMDAAPEIIIYIGVVHHGLLLIDQLSIHDIKVPIILSDGCMADSILNNITKIENKAFVVSPVQDVNDAPKMPSYMPFGHDVYMITRNILNNSRGCTRDKIKKYIKENKGKIKITNGKAGKYKFDEKGNNTDMDYNIFEITSGTLRKYPL